MIGWSVASIKQCSCKYSRRCCDTKHDNWADGKNQSPVGKTSHAGHRGTLLKRRFIGIDQERQYLQIAKNRYLAINDDTKIFLKQKIREQISLI
ncbi:hypothetical protein [Moraxella cuniculi]|uniref:hypothetical protein n=1 Tax=Moraxella cuniculi TaxID=34061 RepID=UPI000F825D57|nr:hypothetical protein [Moraxella cuniculi]